MVAELVLLLAVAVLMLLAVLAGTDTRDGRDWQPRSEWSDRRGAPMG